MILTNTKGRGFLSKPTRGGKLAILNCVLWALIVLSSAFSGGGGIPLAVLLLFLSLPLTPCMALVAIGRSPEGVVLHCILIGVNSLLWGYGLSWLVSVTIERKERRIERFRQENRCIECGYDLRATPERCPECGRVPEKALVLPGEAKCRGGRGVVRGADPTGIHAHHMG